MRRRCAQMRDAGIDANHKVHTLAQRRCIAEVSLFVTKIRYVWISLQCLLVRLPDVFLEANILKIVRQTLN